MEERRKHIEKRIRDSRLKDYEVAAEIGISHYTFCVWKRNFTDERYDKTNAAIDILIKNMWKGAQN